MRLQTTIKITALLVYLIATFAMVMGFMKDNWNYFMLLYIPIIIWLILDLIFNYIKLHPIYKFVIPMIIISYPIISYITDAPIMSLAIIAFVPIIPLFYLTVIRKYKYCVIPLVASVIAFAYVTYGLFTGIWHPTWIVFLFTPLSILFIDFGKK